MNRMHRMPPPIPSAGGDDPRLWEEQIASWLPAARWFAGKDQPLESVSISDFVRLPACGGLALTLLDAHTASGAIRCVVPLATASGTDASGHADLAAWLVRMAFDGTTLEAHHGTFVGRTIVAAPPLERWQEVSLAVLGGDASNSSLLVRSAGGEGRGSGAGGAVVVKLLRHCQPGIHPEVEVGRFLATATTWRQTPPFLGWIEYVPHLPDSPRTVILTVHSFVPECSSAWDRLATLLADGGLAGPQRHTILAIVEALGLATAGLHAALSSRADIADFAPRPASRAGREALAGALVAHARQTLLAARLQQGPKPLAHRLESLARAADRLCEPLAAVAHAGTTAAEIRVHGDYHLGQVLIGPDDRTVLPIDFEGEPRRSLATRREKTSAMKDVAGMCRSFDYLLSHAAGSGAESQAAGDTSRATLVAAFLGAYRGAAVGADWWPADAAEEAILLSAFTIDKAVYELAYELANRPAWVAVPLAFLESQLP